ncbi:hypothetical protein, partial [Escherichia coli]|uniref:hypothetical protein n=1 Tax=Escherichia coli TaxID=562 RepID=UPI001BC84020
MTHFSGEPLAAHTIDHRLTWLLFTSYAADARSLVGLGGSRDIKKKIDVNTLHTFIRQPPKTSTTS